MSIEAGDYRRIIGRFATGVAVLTTANDGLLHGMTANTITSVSLEPLLLLVCIETSANAHEQVEATRRFTVNVLAADQEDASVTFAAKSEAERGRLQGVNYRLGTAGVPIIDGCLAFIECAVSGSFEGGDHTVYLASVEHAEVLRDAPPLIFYQGKYRELA